MKHIMGIFPIELGKGGNEELNFAQRHEGRKQAVQVSGERIFQTKGKTNMETLRR